MFVPPMSVLMLVLLSFSLSGALCYRNNIYRQASVTALKILGGYFRAKYFFKVFLKILKCSVQRCPTLEHSFIVIIIFFELQTVRIEFFFFSCAVFLGFCNILSFNCQDLSNHLGLLAVPCLFCLV